MSSSQSSCAREIFTVDHTYYKGLDEKERLSSVTKKPLKLTKNFTGADAKGCVTLCRWNFVRKKPGIIQISYVKKQDSRKLWKTLNELLPNKKQHKTANAPASETFTATSFNEFFTSVADNPCGHYKSKNRLLLLLELRKTLLFKRCQLTLFWRAV